MPRRTHRSPHPKRRATAWLVAACCASAAPLHAQGATGTIEGSVLVGAGTPIADAAVTLVGESHHTRTGPDGFFRLTFVPVGTYTLHVSASGDAVTEHPHITVHAGGVTHVRIIVAPPSAASTEAGMLLPYATGAAVTGLDIDRLPIDDPTDAVRLLAGTGSGRDDALLLRGSRPGDHTVVVNGVPVRTFDSGTAPIGFAPNALEAAAVHMGPLGAPWGDAGAGIVSFTTARGTGGWTGGIAYESDAVGGGTERAGLQRLEASASGRITERLSVFAGGAASTRQAVESNAGIADQPIFTYGPLDTILMLPEGFGERPDTIPFPIPQILQYGGTCSEPTVDSLDQCLGRRRPRAWASDSRWNANVRYDLGSGSAATLTAAVSARQGIDWTPVMHEEGRPGTRTTAGILSLDWVQRVLRRGEAQLTLHATLSRQTDRSIAGATTEIPDLADAVPSLGRAFDPLGFEVDFDTFGDADPAQHLTHDSTTGGYVLARLREDADWDAMIENVRYNRGTRRPFLGRTDVQPTATTRLNPYGVLAPYPRTGLDFGQSMVDERRTYARVALDWQARYYRITAGLETTRGRVGHWDADWTTLSAASIYAAEPRKTGLFVSIAPELDVLRVDAGLRVDWFDAGLARPLVPGRTFTHPAFNPDSTTASMTCAADAASCDASRHVWIASRTYRSVSPTVRVLFPLGTRGSLRLGYAHQVQAPPLAVLAAGANDDVSAAGSDGLFGGDVGPSRTVHYEAGTRWDLGGGFTVDGAVYFKDLQHQLAYRYLPVFDPVLDSTVTRRIATNADIGDVRGLDVGITKRWDDWFSVALAYSVVSARSTGSNATDYVFGWSQLVPPEGVDTVPPPDIPFRTRDTRAHQLSATVVFASPRRDGGGSVVGSIMSDWGAYLTARVAAGLPYTRFANDADGVRSDWTMLPALRAVDELQGSATGWEQYLDLRITKAFQIGPIDIEVYGDFRNLLGIGTTPLVFAETGTDENQAHRDRLVQYELDRIWDDGYGVRTTIEKADPDGANVRIVDALDLRSLGPACAEQWYYWEGGTVACVMLERTEQRFGNGDGYFDVEEQEAAVTAWYESIFNPAHFAGPGRSIRIGVRVGF